MPMSLSIRDTFALHFWDNEKSHELDFTHLCSSPRTFCVGR
jgi:hypothetical protein